MRCDEAREEILTAGVSELTGEATATPLSTHLSSCSACRRRADAVLGGQEDLARALDRMSSTAGARGDEARSGRAPRLLSGGIGAVLAAAAVLLVWIRPGFLSLGGEGGDAVVVVGERGAPASLEVDVPPDGRMAVIETGDPRFVVVWQYDPTH